MLKHTTKIPGKGELENRCRNVTFHFRAKGDRLGDIYNVVKTFFKPINFQEQQDYKNGGVDMIIQGDRKIPYVIYINYKKPKKDIDYVDYSLEVTFPEEVRDTITPRLTEQLKRLMNFSD